MGKATGHRSREIVAKRAFFPERDAVFRARDKLKGTMIFISEDFCPGTMEVRRNQMDTMKEVKRNGKQAFFNYCTLVIRGGSGGAGGGRDRHAGEGERLVPPPHLIRHHGPLPMSTLVQLIIPLLRFQRSQVFRHCPLCLLARIQRGVVWSAPRLGVLLLVVGRAPLLSLSATEVL